MQGYSNPGCHVAMATILCVVTPNAYGFSVWNLLYVTVLAPRIFYIAPRFSEYLCVRGIVRACRSVGLSALSFFTFVSEKHIWDTHGRVICINFVLL
jgi:hypothetical protein